eukprot:jgi/Chlat1/5770/Chrsp387S05497
MAEAAEVAGFTGRDRESYLATRVQPTWQKGGGVPGDPGKHSWQTLAGFVATLNSPEDDKAVKRKKEWFYERKALAEAEKSDPWRATKEQALVERTKQHPKFPSSYDFPSDQRGWKRSERGTAQEEPSPPILIGIDCEMCATDGNHRELVRVAVVDRDLKVLFNAVVRPRGTVTDYRTNITGVTAEDVKKAEFNHKDAQRAVFRFINRPGTILVGHSLHHDLTALQIDHRRVIDTALLYTYEGLVGAVPSLADLSRLLLPAEVAFRGFGTDNTAGPHDSVEDASTPMRLVIEELKRETPAPPLKPPPGKVDKALLSKLYIHRIPPQTSKAALVALFEPSDGEGAKLKVDIQSLDFAGKDFGTALAVFESVEACNAVFKRLRGNQGKDSLGRHQKMSALPSTGSIVCVRKMACHNGETFGKTDLGPSAPSTTTRTTATTTTTTVVATTSEPSAPNNNGNAASALAESAQKNNKRDKKRKPIEDLGSVEQAALPLSDSVDAKRMKSSAEAPLSTPPPAQAQPRTDANMGKFAPVSTPPPAQAQPRVETMTATPGSAPQDTKKQKQGKGAAERRAEKRRASTGGETGNANGGGAANVSSQLAAMQQQLQKKDTQIAALQRLVTSLATRATDMD